MDIWKTLVVVLATSTTVLGAAYATQSDPPRMSRRADSQTIGASQPARAGSFVRELRRDIESAEAEEEALLDQLVAAPRPALRVDILEQLALVGSEQAVPVVTSLLDNARPTVARAALRTLGFIGGDAATGALVDYIETHRAGLYTREAMESLANIDHPRALERLTSYARDRTHPYRIDAVHALGQSMNPQAESPLLQLTQDRAPGVAPAAVVALSELGTEAADMAVRRLAVEGVGQVRVAALTSLPDASGESTFQELQQLLLTGGPSDSHDAVVQAIVRSGHPDALTTLVRCARSNTQASTRCTYGLAHCSIPGTEAALSDLASSSNWSTVFGALRALGVRGGPDATALLLSYTRHPSRDHRRVAFDALAFSGDPEAEAFFVDTARNGHGNERSGAIQYLANTGHPEAIDLALELATATSADQRMQGLMTLSMIEGHEASNALELLARQGEGPSRAAALQALVRRNEAPNHAQTQLLLEAGRSGDMTLIESAIFGLGRSEDPEARAFLEETARSGNPSLVSAALGALTQSGSDERTQALLTDLARNGNSQSQQTALIHVSFSDPDLGSTLAVELLESDDEMIRQTALHTLMQTNSELAQETLGRLLTHESPSERAFAVNLLSNTRAEGVVAQINQVVHDESPEVRAAALHSLAFLDDEGALEHAIAASEDPDASVRSNAVDIMARTGSQAQVQSHLLRAADDPDEMVQRVAFQSLAAFREGARHLYDRLDREEPEIQLTIARALTLNGIGLTRDERRRIDAILSEAAENHPGGS